MDAAPGGRHWRRDVSLPSTVRLVWHEAESFPRDVPLAALYRDLVFRGAEAGLPYVVANMVMTQNGEAVLLGGASTIATGVDAVIMTRLRTAVDAVLSGSGTLIQDDVTAHLPDDAVRARLAAGKTPTLLVVVVASSPVFGPDVLGHAYFTSAGFEKLIVTAPGVERAAVEALRTRGVDVAEVAAGADGRPSVRAVLELLARRGVASVICEGGPHFLPSLLRGRVVREYFLTTSPILTGRPDAPRPVATAVASDGAPLLLQRLSRYEHAFRDPDTRAPLIEAFDRFRVVYPR